MRFQSHVLTAAILVIGANGDARTRDAQLPAPSPGLDCGDILTPNQKPDEATVRRIERDWLAAEVRGDTPFLVCLLGNDYVNIGKDGKTHPGSDIIAHAEKNRGSSREIPSIESSIVVNGNAATAYSLSKTRDKSGQSQDVHFVDSFVFRDGRWHPYCGVDM